jgi:hypothetical protein
MTKLKTFIFAVIALSLPLIYNQCSVTNINNPPLLEGTSTGNPSIHAEIAGYTTVQSTSISPFAINKLSICIQELRFSNSQDGSGDYSTNMRLGEIFVGREGTDLGELYIRPGTYDTVTFDLDTGCYSGSPSVKVTNSNGTFSTGLFIQIKFYGRLTVTGEETIRLVFNMQRAIDELNKASSSAEVYSAAAGQPGTFEQF